MSKITKNYIYNLLYQLFILLVPVVTAPYLSRVLGANNQGVSSYVISISNLVGSITMLGTFTYGNRQIAYERDNKKKMSQTFWEIMMVRFVLGVIGSVVYFLLALKLTDYTRYLFLYYFWLLATYIDCTWVFVGVEDMKLAVIKNFIAKLLTVLGMFIFVKNSNDINKYLLLLGLSVLIANLSAYTQLRKYILKPYIDIYNIKKHILGSINLFLPYVATLLYLQVDKIMIEVFTNTTNQVSFYDNAEKIVTIPLAFITVISTVMMPRIANEYLKNNIANIEKYLIKVGRISLFLAFPMTIGIMSIASKFIPWYLGNEFLPVIIAIIFISPIIISNSLEGISGRQYFTATNQISILLKSYIFTAITNVVINLILIPKWGFIGSAIATLISSYICVLIQFYYLNKQISMRGLIPYSIRYLIYSLIMGAVVYLLSKNLQANPITTVIQIFSGGSIYLFLCFINKDIILKEVIDKVKDYLKGFIKT